MNNLKKMHGSAGDCQFCFPIRGFGAKAQVETRGLAASLIGLVISLLTGDAILLDAKSLISLKRRNMLADTETPVKQPNPLESKRTLPHGHSKCAPCLHQVVPREYDGQHRQ
jgi:hypothetical protein